MTRRCPRRSRPERQALKYLKYNVIPAKAGIQAARTQSSRPWIPAFAGMTKLCQARPIARTGCGSAHFYVMSYQARKARVRVEAGLWTAMSCRKAAIFVTD